MQGVVGGVEVEDDPSGRRFVRLKKQVDEQALDGGAVMADFVVARGSNRRMLKPVQGALAGKRRAAFALGREFAGQRREHRVVAIDRGWGPDRWS